MKQPSSRVFQALWTILHLQAALLAQVAVLMHLGSAEYHRRRMMEDAEDEAAAHDRTYRQAIIDRQGGPR